MRFIFLNGGFLGFILVVIAGVLADRPIDHVLRDAAVGALVGAFLFRWFWEIFVKALSQAVRSKRATQAAAEEAAATAARAAQAAQVAKVK